MLETKRLFAAGLALAWLAALGCYDFEAAFQDCVATGQCKPEGCKKEWADAPDEYSHDNNCDGIDGDPNNAFFVDPVLGKNTNFRVISGLALRDAVPANTEFVSVSAALVAGSRYAYPVAARVLYSLDGAVWTPNVPDAAAVGSGSVYAAIDTDGNGMLTAADVVLPDQGLRLTLTVRIR